MQTQTFIFYGQVGSGKGTQVGLLVDYLKSKDDNEQINISTGALYRELTSSGVYAGSLVKDAMENGALLPDLLTTSIFMNVLINSLKEKTHLFADGYPRTVGQSKDFERMMKFFKRENVKIIYIELSEAEAMKRNLLRGRVDDTEEGLRMRFNEYKNNVIPSMNYFKDKDGYEIFTINGEQSIEDVHKDIINKLGFSV